MDSVWATKHVAQIFPKEQSARMLWEAAWASYVCLRDPSRECLTALESNYYLAIDRLDDCDYDAMKGRLAEHLMAFFWNGDIDFTDSDGMLERFWIRASIDVRRTALFALGRWLRKEEFIAPDILKRLQRLWEWRLLVVLNEGLDPKELAFGWWFASGRFDSAWALEQLENVLKLGAPLEVTFDFMQQLAKSSFKSPLKGLLCLEGIVRQHRSLWMLCGAFENEMRWIFAFALKSDGNAVSNAKGLVNYLASAGFRQFRDLLA